jgi:hypothetical protein
MSGGTRRHGRQSRLHVTGHPSSPVIRMERLIDFQLVCLRRKKPDGAKRQTQYGACGCLREAMASRMTGLHARDARRRSDALCACHRDTAVLHTNGGQSSPRVQVSWNWREPSAKASRTTCLQGRMDQRRTLPKWRAQIAYECKRMGPCILAMHAMRCV